MTTLYRTYQNCPVWLYNGPQCVPLTLNFSRVTNGRTNPISDACIFQMKGPFDIVLAPSYRVDCALLAFQKRSGTLVSFGSDDGNCRPSENITFRTNVSVFVRGSLRTQRKAYVDELWSVSRPGTPLANLQIW